MIHLKNNVDSVLGDSRNIIIRFQRGTINGCRIEVCLVGPAAILALGAGLVLLPLQDIHGAALLFGASIAWILRWLDH